MCYVSAHGLRTEQAQRLDNRHNALGDLAIHRRHAGDVQDQIARGCPFHRAQCFGLEIAQSLSVERPDYRKPARQIGITNPISDKTFCWSPVTIRSADSTTRIVVTSTRAAICR